MSIKNKKKIILIIPAYNEEDNILNTVKTIEKYNMQNNTNYDIVVINCIIKDC